MCDDYIEIECDFTLNFTQNDNKKVRLPHNEGTSDFTPNHYKKIRLHRKAKFDDYVDDDILNIDMKQAYFNIYDMLYINLYLNYNNIPNKYKDLRDIIEICGYYYNFKIIMTLIFYIRLNYNKNSKTFLNSLESLLIIKHLKKNKKIIYIHPFILINDEDLIFKNIFFKYIEKIKINDLTIDPKDQLFLKKELLLIRNSFLHSEIKVSLTQHFIIKENFDRYINDGIK